MLADRAAARRRGDPPALAAGKVVVSDRYTPSTLTYQGVGRALGVDPVERLSAFAAGELEPDLVVVLDLPDDVASSAGRRRRRPDGTGRGRLPRRGAGGVPGAGGGAGLARWSTPTARATRSRHGSGPSVAPTL